MDEFPSFIHLPFQSYLCVADNLNFPEKMAKNINYFFTESSK